MKITISDDDKKTCEVVASALESWFSAQSGFSCIADFEGKYTGTSKAARKRYPLQHVKIEVIE